MNRKFLKTYTVEVVIPSGEPTPGEPENPEAWVDYFIDDKYVSQSIRNIFAGITHQLKIGELVPIKDEDEDDEPEEGIDVNVLIDGKELKSGQPKKKNTLDELGITGVRDS